MTSADMAAPAGSQGLARVPRHSTTALAFVALLFLALSAKAQDTQSPSLETRLTARAQKAMVEERLVGLAVAVVRGEEIIYARGFGFAQRAKKIPVTLETRFRWASISKPVTAVRAMQLWERGALDLDKPVRRYVSAWPKKKYPVTSRQLLCHQGGIPHYRNGTIKPIKPQRYEDEHPYADVVTALDKFRGSPLLHEPGSAYSYTTYGYMLLGAVVQEAGEAPLWTQVREHIATPLGLTTLRPDYQWEDIPHRAVGYKKLPTEGWIRSTNTDVSWKLAGGGFISTVEDLARFGSGVLTGKLLKKSTRDVMWTAQPTSNGKSTHYALGWSIGRKNGHFRASHSGAQEKTSTYLLLEPGTGLTVAVMTNTEGASLGRLAGSLLKIATETTPPTRKDAREPTLFQQPSAPPRSGT
ncbi:MAG: serine hydrolase domain-containing protein [Planctomycetota bacterium]|jgi:CubicO group peptidase (beta-lactamase class C family)